jgi:hypothetical protein
LCDSEHSLLLDNVQARMLQQVLCSAAKDPANSSSTSKASILSWLLSTAPDSFSLCSTYDCAVNLNQHCAWKRIPCWRAANPVGFITENKKSFSSQKFLDPAPSIYPLWLFFDRFPCIWMLNGFPSHWCYLCQFCTGGAVYWQKVLWNWI